MKCRNLVADQKRCMKYELIMKITSKMPARFLNVFCEKEFHSTDDVSQIIKSLIIPKSIN